MSHYILGNRDKTKFLASGEEPYVVHDMYEAFIYSSIEDVREEVDDILKYNPAWTKETVREEIVLSQELDEDEVIGDADYTWTEDDIESTYQELIGEMTELLELINDFVVYEVEFMLKEV